MTLSHYSPIQYLFYLSGSMLFYSSSSIPDILQLLVYITCTDWFVYCSREESFYLTKCLTYFELVCLSVRMSRAPCIDSLYTKSIRRCLLMYINHRRGCVCTLFFKWLLKNLRYFSNGCWKKSLYANRAIQKLWLKTAVIILRQTTVLR